MFNVQCSMFNVQYMMYDIQYQLFGHWSLVIDH
jgi:hypothetical protein